MQAALFMLLIVLAMGYAPDSTYPTSSSFNDFDDKCFKYLNANIGNTNGTLQIGGSGYESSCVNYSNRAVSNFREVQVNATCYDMNWRPKQASIKIPNPICNGWRLCVTMLIP